MTAGARRTRSAAPKKPARVVLDLTRDELRDGVAAVFYPVLLRYPEPAQEPIERATDRLIAAAQDARR